MSEPIITNLENEELKRPCDDSLTPQKFEEMLNLIVLDTARKECEMVLAKGITDPVKLYQIAVLSALSPKKTTEKIIEEVNEND